MTDPDSDLADQAHRNVEHLIDIRDEQARERKERK